MYYDYQFLKVNSHQMTKHIIVADGYCKFNLFRFHFSLLKCWEFDSLTDHLAKINIVVEFTVSIYIVNLE